MKFKKILKIVFSAVAALLLLGVLTFLFWLGPTIKFVAHTIGPKALGTELRIEKLKVNPIKGIIQLSDLSIKNPHMFGQSNAVSVASLNISIDMASLFTSTVVVHRVEINSPYLIYEQDLSSDNITEFIRNIQDFAKIDPAAPPKPKKQKKEPKEPVIVIVESLAINDVQFNLANTHDNKLDIGVGFDQLSISMTNGTARLDNFYVNNPKRLETKNLFTLDTVNIQMDPDSIYSTNIHFKSILIENPHAFIEFNPKTDTAGEFLKIANSLLARVPTNAPQTVATNILIVADSDTTGEPTAPPPTITLDEFIIDDVQIHSVNISNPQLDILMGFRQFYIALEEGRIELDRLYLSNPAALSTPDLISLDLFTMQIKPETLFSETVVIENIQLTKPHTFLELNEETDTVSEFLKIANGYLNRIPSYEIPQLPAAPQTSMPQIEAQAEPTSDSPPPFELHNLVIDDIQLQLLDRSDTNNPAMEPHMIAGIEEVALQLFEGKLQVNNIRVPNVAGFDATNIFHLANIDVDIEPGSIHGDQFVINKVFVNSPNVHLEQTEDSGNIASLQTTLMKFAPAPEELPKISAAEIPAGEHPVTVPTNAPIPLAEQPAVLHQLLVTNLAIHLVLPPNTNHTALANLNPMNDLSWKDLNPLNKKESASTNSVAEQNLPMELIAFDLLSIEPLKGLVSIKNLQISNPPGFSRKNLIQLEEFRIDIDPDSIRSDTMHIEDIMITKPRIRYERQVTSDNIKTLKTQIEQAVMRREHQMAENTNTVAESESKPVATEPNPPAQKVIIDRVLIPNGMVEAKLSALPSIPVPLPTIELKDLGKDKGGTSLTEAGNKIFESLYDAIIGSVGSATGFAGDALKGLGNLTMEALDSATGDLTAETKNAIDKTIEKSKKKRKIRRPGGRRSPL